ncbi:chymotrypsin-C-like [Phlebotomus argentipes]|uniref:chymotrypsin-C-like n=1 Tax=Phlebotomus argentipes TaxID=94469 RepID=UPI0028934E18|nr:chymotrypsin-C-like [Phlebotomus argentipes]
MHKKSPSNRHHISQSCVESHLRMSVAFFSVFLLVFLVQFPQSRAQDGMSYIGSAVEAFNPCKNGVISMYREIGGPPNLENYWDGTFYLENWPNIPEVRIEITLDAPARMEIDPDEARIHINGRSFYISTFKAPPKIDKVKFTVRGRPRGKFPNVVSVHLNGADVCPMPAKWEPSFLGTMDKIETDDFEAPVKTSSGNGECGIRRINHEGLITYGEDTRPGDYPWHAAIFHLERRQRSYKCGGTIINTHTVLTAAHCVFEGVSPITAERFIVQVGKYHLNVADDSAKEFTVFSVIPHPRYDTSLLSNDIALLRLSREIQYSDYIQPICLWTSNTSLSQLENRLATAVGWGYTENDTVADSLRYVQLPIVPTLTCLESDRDFFGLFLSDTNFCAGYTNGTNVCSGDSGGSLAFEDEQKVWHIRGIVSLSIRKRDKNVCNPKHYVLFTDVAKYLPWIEKESSRIATDGRRK